MMYFESRSLKVKQFSMNILFCLFLWIYIHWMYVFNFVQIFDLPVMSMTNERDHDTNMLALNGMSVFLEATFQEEDHLYEELPALALRIILMMLLLGCEDIESDPSPKARHRKAVSLT